MGGEPLLLGENHPFLGHVIGPQALVEDGVQLGDTRPRLADAQQQLGDECRMDRARPRRLRQRRVGRNGLDPGEVFFGPDAFGARLEHRVGEPAQVLEQSELQHARPRPDLAESQGHHGLVGDHEADDPIDVDPSVALVNDLLGHGVDPRDLRSVARLELRKLCVVTARQIVPRLANLGFDEVEVVQQPLGRGLDQVAAASIVGEDPVGLAQARRVVARPTGEIIDSPAPMPRQHMAGCERPRALLERLDAEGLRSRWLIGAAARRTAFGGRDWGPQGDTHRVLSVLPRTKPGRRQPCGQATEHGMKRE